MLTLSSCQVHHGNKPTPTRKEIRDKLAALYKVKDSQTIVVFGLVTKYGGGITDGFALIYDSLDVLKKIEPGFRLRKNGFDAPNPHTGTTRKQVEKGLAGWGLL
jgi:small subunit ribosomal protein S24e